jgi:AAA family ATPase
MDNDDDEHDDDDILRTEIISTALQERIVMEGCTMLLSTDTYGYVMIRVTNIVDRPNLPDVNDTILTGTVYKLSCTNSYHFHIEPPPTLSMSSDATIGASDSLLSRQLHDTYIPGYSELHNEIVTTLDVAGRYPVAAVSGILLTGCAGVGKTRMASCVAHRYYNNIHNNSDDENYHRRLRTIYYLSVQDLIFQASTEMDLLENVLVPNLMDCSMWIIDDLHLLESEHASTNDGAYTTQQDVEYILVRNALVEAIDRYHNQCRILGICQRETMIPNELTKIGRLEKTIQMFPPTQAQRILIWKSILSHEYVVESDAVCEQWSSALASSTPGFVARDILRVYHDAITRRLALAHSENVEQPSSLTWNDLFDAVKTVVPSQLAELDVIKPTLFGPGLSRKEIHNLSWKDFGGYSSVKKHVYRHVVSPWRHFLETMDSDPSEEGTKSWLEPPPGVLFHGKSGTGKTRAAKCLAASLELPVIQVRAADVLDKWLGGSESLLRSLFDKARSASPCILFLDEIDAIANNREEEETTDLSSRILSTLLNEMDGISSSVQKSRVLVIACTNRLGSLDAALLRPGRLQEHILMDDATPDDLQDILRLRLERVPFDSSLSLEKLALSLFQKSATGADVEGLVREVCMIAMRDCEVPKELVVSEEHFKIAIDEMF